MDFNFGRLRPSRVRAFFRENDGVVGAIAAQIHDVLGRGEQDVLAEIRVFSEYRLRATNGQGSPSADVGAESGHEELTAKPRRTSPGHSAARPRPSSQRSSTCAGAGWGSHVRRPQFQARTFAPTLRELPLV